MNLENNDLENVVGGKGLSISECKLCKKNFPASEITSNGGYCNYCVKAQAATYDPISEEEFQRQLENLRKNIG